MEQNLIFNNYEISIRGLLYNLEFFDKNLKVFTSEGNSIENEFGSDRGDYYKMYIKKSYREKEETLTVGDLINLLNNALEVGAMEGYKGGEFNINLDTIVRVTADESISGFDITSVVQHQDKVYLLLY